MKLLRTILTATAIVTAGPALAEAVTWSSAATSCIPDPFSIQRNSYEASSEKVVPRANSVDQVRLTCTVDPTLLFSESSWKLSVTYRDSTGLGKTAGVVASLIAISRTSGGGVKLATFDSSTSSKVGVTTGSTSFDRHFRPDDYYYVIQITLRRTVPGEIVEVYGVALIALGSSWPHSDAPRGVEGGSSGVDR